MLLATAAQAQDDGFKAGGKQQILLPAFLRSGLVRKFSEVYSVNISTDIIHYK